MKAKISEIFRSIQGEGKYIGVPQVFVRFFGCNLQCSWCDTPSSRGEGNMNFEEFDLEEVMFHIDRLNTKCHSVSFTGGEPLLQADFLSELLPACKKKGISTYLETNGICFRQLKKIIHDIDIIAMDMKMPSSAKCRPLWYEHKEFLQIAKNKEFFVKTVVSNDTQEEDIIKVVDLLEEVNEEVLLILQPNTFELSEGVIKKCYQFLNVSLNRLNQVRVMPQMHKLLGVR